MTQNNNREPVATEENKNSIVNMLHQIGPGPTRKEMKEIASAFKNEGGDFQEYKRWVIRVMSVKWSNMAWKNWQQASKEWDLSTLENYQRRYKWKTNLQEKNN